jgi:hypothetical protein
MDSKTVLFLIEMALKYGVPATKQIIEAWTDEKGEITVDDFIELEKKMKRAEEYFK